MYTPQKQQSSMLPDSRRYNQQCVCQICTCGHHKCPKAKLAFQGETTHHHDYKPYQINPERQEPCTHQYHQRHYDPSALKTSYDTTYKPYQIQNQGLNQSKYQYKPRSGKFYGETQYGSKYVKKEITPQKSAICNHHYHRNTTKFQGTSTYTAQFRPKTANKPIQTAHYKYERRKVPFQGETTYDSNFKPYMIQPNKMECTHQCQCNYRNKTKFEGQSHYKTNYKAHQICHQAHCPILDMPQYPRQCSPGKRHVNYSAQKNKWY